MNVSNMYIGSPAQNPTGFQLLAYSSLTPAAASMTVSFDARSTLRIIIAVPSTAAADTLTLSLVSDAGNYSYTYSDDGAADANATAQNNWLVSANSTSGKRFIVCDVLNNLNKPKRLISLANELGTAAVAPHRTECIGVWENNSQQAGTLTLATVGANNLGAGTEIWVYGAN